MSRALFPSILLFALIGCSSTQLQDGVQSYDNITIDSSTHIDIERNGVRFYGGANPVIKSVLHISNNGEVVQVTEQMYTGRREATFSISRSELENLALFIQRKGFFLMKDIYDCQTSLCEERKKKYPPATPVTISVTIGTFSKNVKVTVLDREYLDYPEEFDLILGKLSNLTEHN